MATQSVERAVAATEVEVQKVAMMEETQAAPVVPDAGSHPCHARHHAQRALCTYRGES